MSLNCRKPSATVPASSKPEENPMPKRKKPNWRLPLVAIRFIVALFSLSRALSQIALVRNKQILRSLSSHVIDIGDESSVHHDNGDPDFLNIDQIKILRGIVRKKCFNSLVRFGGVKQVAALLQTDEKNGIRGIETQLLLGRTIFGSNNYKIPCARSFFSFAFKASKDTPIGLLLVVALLSFVIDTKQHGWKQGWYEGGSIIFVAFCKIIVSFGSNFDRNRQFKKLSNKIPINVEVVRDGRRQYVSVSEVVVGDVVLLKSGDKIPADGLFLNGDSLKVDESSVTGKSVHAEINDSKCPFLLSGTKVTAGYGSMLIVSVGMNTVWGETKSSIDRDMNEESIPLQASLNKINSHIGKIGLVASLLVLFVLLIRYFPGNSKFNCNKANDYDIMIALVRTNAAIVTIVVVAIPEGLPLAVTLTLAYSMKRMMADNVLVRKRSACEQIVSAIIICTDKTGTLTLNEMKVTKDWISEIENTIASEIPPNVYELLQEGVALNTSGTVYESDSATPAEISENPTEKAILSWAVALGINPDYPKQNCQKLPVEAFNSEKRRSGVLMKRISERAIHTHWKGDAEIILDMCSHSYDRNGVMRVMNNEKRLEIEAIIKDMAANSLQCIAFAHTQVPEGDVRIKRQLEESGLTLVAIVGLKYTCRSGVRMAVESCKKAGVNVKMITEDNVCTAKAIAIECGILNPNEDINNDAVVEGVQFRSYSPEERMSMSGKIRVMARSSHSDKLLMVKCLKGRGEVVAVTGDWTNDAPALKAADIGLSMGTQGTEVAKESSDIVILDDNFSSVVIALRWGRCVYNNIQKFIQLQLTVNVAALVINFTAAVSSGDIPLTAVQLLWVNLIMDTVGALALATERPTSQLMTKPPVRRTEPLITKVMWRNLLAQALYQVIVLLTLQFSGRSIFKVDEKVKNTLIFNIFMLCQIFNMFNARNMEKKNIFEGLHQNKLFVGFVGMTLILQVVMVEFLTKRLNWERWSALNWEQWSACVGFAAVSWFIGWVVKLIPPDSFTHFRARRPCITWNSKWE